MYYPYDIKLYTTLHIEYIYTQYNNYYMSTLIRVQYNILYNTFIIKSHLVKLL